MFDLRAATRQRPPTASTFTRFGPINLRNARHAADPRTLLSGKPMPAATRICAGANRNHS